MKNKREKPSKIRKIYMARFVCRVAIFLAFCLLFLLSPDAFGVLSGRAFFLEFSPLHLLWLLWVFDMLCQMIPIKKQLSLGSQKLFRERFRPIKEKISYENIKAHAISTTRAAYKVFVLWGALIAVIGGLRLFEIIDDSILFMISVAFYVCDLICVLFFCPFRLIMKNRCCTTCRIFNWDHLMMLSPMIFIKGFYSLSLVLIAFIVWVVWESCVFLYPERFWEQSNAALKCSECTDKLCTQYCRKLRRK
jgi:hypothetical protein